MTIYVGLIRLTKTAAQGISESRTTMNVPGYFAHLSDETARDIEQSDEVRFNDEYSCYRNHLDILRKLLCPF